jgi:GT2 family glycosyltransferase
MVEASVIVPHYDQPGLLRLCLESLERQSLDRARYEIIVADNGTPGGLDALKARFPGVIFTTALERGAAPARNAGLAIARGATIAFTDADCVAAPDWLENGLAALADADLCGGRIVVTPADDARLTDVEAFERVFAFRQRDYVERKGFAATANLFARREAAERIGPFTNGLSEDVDWCRRGAALGLRLAFNDRSIVSHPARRDWSELVRKWDRIILERWNGFSRTSLSGRAQWLILAAATALSAVPHLVRVAFSPELQKLKDRAAAAGVLARIRVWRAARMTALLCAGRA